MTYDNFTTQGAAALAQAQHIAAGYEQSMVDTAHIVKGLLETEQTISFLLKKVGVDIKNLESLLLEQINSYPRAPNFDQQFLNSDANKAVLNAAKLSKSLGDEFVASEV